jgi:hypothetical protein
VTLEEAAAVADVCHDLLVDADEAEMAGCFNLATKLRLEADCLDQLLQKHNHCPQKAYEHSRSIVHIPHQLKVTKGAQEHENKVVLSQTV